MNSLFSKLPLLALTAVLFAGCSGGSGQDVQTNVNQDVSDEDTGIVYNGPSPSTDDVQNFKLNVWDKLAGEDRCGACHVAGGQSPQFVRADDINLAYQAANTIVDLSAPALSRMVTKVGGGHQCWRPELSVCADTITNFIAAWANDSGAEVNEIILTAPPEREVVDSKSFPDTPDTFISTVYPLLVENCASCHAEEGNPQQRPYFGSKDHDVAYGSAKSKINLDSPAESRFYVRLASEGHNCWPNEDNPAQDSCAYSSGEMLTALEAFSNGIAVTEVDPALHTSRALRLEIEGIVASSGGRYESDVIALYQFKAGEGSPMAFDTSGVEPALDLTLSGNYAWEGNWGVSFDGGKAQGSTSGSQKLHRLITATGEYSVEAWVVPGNVAQDGPARIVTYSGGSDATNFTLGQTIYNYDFLTRGENFGADGMPGLSTPNADEVLQATLQHVVVNYDLLDGRSIYVNGELVADDPEAAGHLNDWDDTFALAVGNEVDNQQMWQGTVRFLAVHSRVLTPEQIVSNYDAGVGEKFFMLFGVSHLIDVPSAYVAFEAQQFDSYSYLFSEPFFISLDPAATIPGDIAIEGIHIGINGKEAPIGQAFANVAVTINSENYSPDGVPMSALGALIPLEKGAAEDDFFLTFDRIGERTYTRVDDTVLPEPTETNIAEQADIGLRIFGEINATLANLTGVDSATPSVAAVYELVRQQLPVSEQIEGFLAAHQAGVMQLSVAYCTELVSDSSARASYFPGFNFGGSLDSGSRDLIVDPLLAGLTAAQVNVDGEMQTLATQPDVATLKTHLYNLINDMSSADTQTAVIAVCAAAGGSAVMLLQ